MYQINYETHPEGKNVLKTYRGPSFRCGLDYREHVYRLRVHNCMQYHHKLAGLPMCQAVQG